MPTLDYFSSNQSSGDKPPRGFPRMTATVFKVIGAVILILIIIGWILSYPGESDVRGWLNSLPKPATSTQVLAMFKQKGIAFESDEAPGPDNPVRMIYGIIDKGDDIIEVRVEIDPNDHMGNIHTTIAHRGL